MTLRFNISGFSYFVVGYLSGMLFSDYIHGDFTLTAWTNIWTYIWIFFWPLCLMFYFFYYALAVALIVGLIYLAHDRISERFRTWNHRRHLRRMQYRNTTRPPR